MIAFQQVARDDVSLHRGDWRQRQPAARRRVARRIDHRVRCALEILVNQDSLSVALVLGLLEFRDARRVDDPAERPALAVRDRPGTQQEIERLVIGAPEHHFHTRSFVDTPQFVYYLPSTSRLHNYFQNSFFNNPSFN
jgi:hypothetical protein